MDNQELYITQRTPMGDDDIRRFLGKKVKIIEFNELDNYNNINRLLTKNVDYCVILYGIKAVNNGHWVSLFKRDNIISFFDSYGLKPEVPLKKWISNEQNEAMEQDGNLLIKLLNTHKGNVFYNDYSYQDNTNFDISTCGRWAVSFIQFMKMNKNHTLRSYNKFILDLKKNHTELDNDEIVSLLVN
jgi:hypothetical protein